MFWRYKKLWKKTKYSLMKDILIHRTHLIHNAFNLSILERSLLLHVLNTCYFMVNDNVLTVHYTHDFFE